MTNFQAKGAAAPSAQPTGGGGGGGAVKAKARAMAIHMEKLSEETRKQKKVQPVREGMSRLAAGAQKSVRSRIRTMSSMAGGQPGATAARYVPSSPVPSPVPPKTRTM